MITVRLFHENGRVVRVQTAGHSGLAQSGNDVLCAAVSTLVQTAYLALSDITGSELEYARESGRFCFDVPSGRFAHDADVVIRAMYLGLKDLSSGYPQNLKLEEV